MERQLLENAEDFFKPPDNPAPRGGRRKNQRRNKNNNTTPKKGRSFSQKGQRDTSKGDGKRGGYHGKNRGGRGGRGKGKRGITPGQGDQSGGKKDRGRRKDDEGRRSRSPNRRRGRSPSKRSKSRGRYKKPVEYKIPAGDLPLMKREGFPSIKNCCVEGRLERDSKGKIAVFGALYRFLPFDVRITKIGIKRSQFKKEGAPDPSGTITVQISAWPLWSKYPLGFVSPARNNKNKLEKSSSIQPRQSPSAGPPGGAAFGTNSESFSLTPSVAQASNTASESATVESHGSARDRKEGKEGKAGKKRKAVFNEYISVEEVEASPQLVISKLRVNRRNPRKAYVPRPKPKEGKQAEVLHDILIDGFTRRNRALDGDTVAVRILEGKKPGREGQDQGEIVAILNSTAERKVTGCLWGAQADGSVKPNDKVCRFVPLDKRLPIALIGRSRWPLSFKEELERKKEDSKANKKEDNKNENNEEKVGRGGIPDDAPTMIYVAKYQSWGIHQKMPFVSIIDQIGMTGNIKAETFALLEECGIDYDFNGDFDQDCLDCLQPFEVRKGKTWTIPEDEIKRRVDLRHKRICTIDPTTARDLDDALSIDPLPGKTGAYRIGVHIADVTHFLTPGSALDKEAKHRATTVYLVQKSLPMLPRLLSENLCSLAPKVDRLAFSCFFTMSATGKLLPEPKPWFGKTVIRTCCQLDYQTAQRLIECDLNTVEDTKDFYEKLEMAERMIPIEGVSLKDVGRDLKIFNKIAMQRRKERFNTGSLSLNRGKVGFGLDNNQLPVEMFVYERRNSNKMIEEYMLLANLLVAEKLLSVFPEKSLIRMQPSPEQKQLLELQAFMKELGYPIRCGSALEVQESLKALEDEKVSGVSMRGIAELLLTKPMMLALYKSSGDDDIESCHHYALNFDSYTHFTSPIRRYVDVIVHRQLAHAIEEEANGSFVTSDVKLPEEKMAKPPEVTRYSQGTIQDIAENCNTRKTNAKTAGEMSSRVYMALCLRTKPIVCDAVIVDMGHKSFKIMISHMGLDEQVFIQDIDAAEAYVVNKQGEKLNDENEKNTPKVERFLHILWAAGGKSERVGILGKITVKLVAKMAPPPISFRVRVINPSSQEIEADRECKASAARTGVVKALSTDPALMSDDI
ncbi:hypothetical protein AAMO2058_000901000 [Amorphochlora amoebiformis]